jgi:hypothetical protein
MRLAEALAIVLVVTILVAVGIVIGQHGQINERCQKRWHEGFKYGQVECLTGNVHDSAFTATWALGNLCAKTITQNCSKGNRWSEANGQLCLI